MANARQPVSGDSRSSARVAGRRRRTTTTHNHNEKPTHGAKEVIPWSEAAGWLGTACILGAYFANVRGLLAPSSTKYLVANLVGSASMAVSVGVAGAWAAVALNVTWGAITIAGLLRRRTARAAG
jgi:hypothetical protein